MSKMSLHAFAQLGISSSCLFHHSHTSVSCDISSAAAMYAASSFPMIQALFSYSWEYLLFSKLCWHNLSKPTPDPSALLHTSHQDQEVQHLPGREGTIITPQWLITLYVQCIQVHCIVHMITVIMKGTKVLTLGVIVSGFRAALHLDT